MKRHRQTLAAALTAAALLVALAACSAPRGEDAAEPAEQRKEEGERLSMRIDAPEGVQSLHVTARATNVDTSGFSDSFNVLKTEKVVYRPDFESTGVVTLAIQSGRVEVEVYAFDSVISGIGEPDFATATYYGGSGSVDVAVGETKRVRVQMAPVVSVGFGGMAIRQSGGQYFLDFTTGVDLPAGSKVTVSFNAHDPSALDFAEDKNVTVEHSGSGAAHTVALGSSTTPYFLKAEIRQAVGGSVYIGEGTVFCAESVCGDLPRVIYDRQIAYVDNESLDQGIIKTWKTTTSSGGSTYFSDGFFDQQFLTRQLTMGVDPNDLGIYRSTQNSFYDPANADASDYGDSAGVELSPSLRDYLTSPAGFFEGLSVLFSGTVVQDLSTFEFYGNTVDCSENLERLGQDCSRVPRVQNVWVEGGLLRLRVFLHEGTRLEVYRRDLGAGLTLVAEIPLAFEPPAGAGGAAASVGVDLAAHVPDPAADYYGRVVNDEFRGSLVDLFVSHWADLSGAAQATEIPDPAQGPYSLGAGAEAYFAADLEAGGRYRVTVEGLRGGANLWELYLVGADGATVLASLSRDLLGSGIDEKQTLDFTAGSTGRHSLKLVNPLAQDLLFILSLEAVAAD